MTTLNTLQFPMHEGKPARWRSIIAFVVTSVVGARSPAKLWQVIRQFTVTTAERYVRGARVTWCNIFATDVIEAMGVIAPRHWSDPDTGAPTPLGVGDELSANLMFDWYAQHGADFGWRKVDAPAARLYALAGKLAVAIWRNPKRRAGALPTDKDQHESGHVSIVVPDEAAELYVAQAGATNSERLKLTHVYTAEQLRAVAYWVHE